MFNRRNFAQLVAGLIPLPFLKLPTLDLEVNDAENVENLPVIKFVEFIPSEDGTLMGLSGPETGTLRPDEKQFQEELDKLVDAVMWANSEDCFIHKAIPSWLEKKYALQNDRQVFWGKVTVEVFVHYDRRPRIFQTEFTFHDPPIRTGFVIRPSKESNSIFANIVKSYVKYVLPPTTETSNV